MGSELKYPLSIVVRAVDKATAPLQRISKQVDKSMSRYTAPFRRLGNRLTVLSKAAGLPRVAEGFKGVGEAAGKVGEQVKRLGGMIAGMVGAALFGGFGLYTLAKGAVDAGDKLGEMSARVGLGVDAYASLEHAAAQADVEQEQFNTAMDTFNKGLGQAKAGTGKLLSFLKQISPTFAKQVKGAKSTEAALSLMTDAFARIEDPGKRAALAAAAFGAGQMQMGEFLHQGSAAIQEQQRRFMELTGSQEEFAKNAGELDNVMRETETAFGGLRNAAMTALFPALTKLSKAVTDFVVKNREGIAQWATRAGAAISEWVEGGGVKRLGETLQSIGRAIVWVVGFLDTWIGKVAVAGVVLGPLIASVGGLISSLWTAGAALAPLIAKIVLFVGPGVAGAFLAAAIGIGAAAYQIWKNWDEIKFLFADFWQTITFYAERAWEKIKPIVEGIGGALKTAAGAVGGAFGKVAGWFGAGDQPKLGSGAAFGASAAAPPAPGQAGSAAVAVSFDNLPRGSRVTPGRDNTAALDLSVGYSMVIP